MAKPRYEGYSDETPTKFVREKFGDTTVYAQNAKSLLTKATGFIAAYDFTLNPYRGCQYGCSYCYAAAFSPNPQMRQDWGKWVIYKENAAEILAKELETWYRKNPNQPPRIYMSSVTDPYQPLESKHQLTRSLLEVMLDYRPNLVIQTRSPIITRDIDYLQRFQRLRINMSIPTGSEAVRRDFEPRSPSIKARLNAINKIRQSIDSFKGFIPKISITITPFNTQKIEDKEQEKNLVCKFVGEFGLELVWYRYLTSTGLRTAYSSGFAKFARENLPKQVYMIPMIKKYFYQNHESNYTLDDYVILAKK